MRRVTTRPGLPRTERVPEHLNFCAQIATKRLNGPCSGLSGGEGRWSSPPLGSSWEDPGCPCLAATLGTISLFPQHLLQKSWSFPSPPRKLSFEK